MPIKMPQPTKQTICGITWREHFNCFSTKLGLVLPMGFQWTRKGYEVTVNGQPLPGLYRTAEEAAKAALDEARRINKRLTQRLAQIEDGGGE